MEQLVHASRLADIRNIVFMVHFLAGCCFSYTSLCTCVYTPCGNVEVSFYTLLSFAGCEQGMGEPLNNYNAVVEAVRVMLNQPFQLSPKRITISTVSTEKATLKHSLKLVVDFPSVYGM